MDVSRTIVATPDIEDKSVTQGKLADKSYALSASCGNYVSTTTSYVDVTNLTCTITRTGRPVVIMLQSDGDTAVNADGKIEIGGTSANPISVRARIVRDGTEIAKTGFSGDNGGAGTMYYSFPAAGVSFVDTSTGTGSATYKVQINVLNATNQVNVRYSKLLVYEL